ncbi:MAG: sodium-dependent transporter [Fretibacterium sp.]|nr:sodium-dependent transporter [Fretibacterium sp.]
MSSESTGLSSQRENWGSRFGFIMAAAGSAIGLGNIWRFPYLVGKHGGAAFVLVYLILIAVVGSTVMMAEFAIGRASRKSTVGAFWVLSDTHSWTLVGWIATAAGGFIILSYYAVIGGWTIKYIIGSLTDLMPMAAEGKSGEVFSAFVSNSQEVVLYQVIFMALTMFIVSGGVGKGIERACKVMMPLLFLILIVLIVRSVTLTGAEKGLEYYLKPDFSKLSGESVLDALGQGFFSLSLGMSIMITYGSYISKEENLANCAGWIITADTLIALLAGLAIFPAAFAMGVEPGSGAGLTFITLPGVFAKMPFGNVFSALFFVLLFFAAITSSMSLFEVSVSHCIDDLKWTRKKSILIMGFLITLLGIPSALSLATTPEGNPAIAIAGKSFLDAMDIISNNVMMPLSAIFTCIFAGWAWYDSARKELTNQDTITFKLLPAWTVCVRFVAPVAIAVIFYMGLKW